MMNCNSYYGGFRTRMFAEIYPNAFDFKEAYTTSPLSMLNEQALITEDTINLIYYLLYARYGNSHIAYSDENQFKYAMFSTIFMYAPTWQKRLDIQANLRALSEEEIIAGSKAIYNHAFNPSTEPSTSSLSELIHINEQNTTNYKKSKMEAYAMLTELIDTDVTEEFVAKFKKLFLTVVSPDYPLLYATEEEN